jgi:ribosomal protein S18 acetylase RimI-like enzyme
MITLIPIEQGDFDSFLEQEIVLYANEKVKSGDWPADKSLDKSRSEFQKMLPDGLRTKDHHVFTIFNEDTNCKLGVLWIQIRTNGPRRHAFINEFVIQEAQRRKGFGKKALQALDGKLQAMSIESVELHVFGHNTNAIELYKKMGYEVTNLYMSKKILVPDTEHELKDEFS